MGPEVTKNVGDKKGKKKGRQENHMPRNSLVTGSFFQSYSSLFSTDSSLKIVLLFCRVSARPWDWECFRLNNQDPPQGGPAGPLETLSQQGEDYLIGQNFGGQNCRKFDWLPKILSAEKFCPPKILSAEMFCPLKSKTCQIDKNLMLKHVFLVNCIIK